MCTLIVLSSGVGRSVGRWGWRRLRRQRRAGRRRGRRGVAEARTEEAKERGRGFVARRRAVVDRRRVVRPRVRLQTQKTLDLQFVLSSQSRCLFDSCLSILSMFSPPAGMCPPTPTSPSTACASASRLARWSRARTTTARSSGSTFRTSFFPSS